MTDGGPSNTDIARRLVVLRDALGHNQSSFAKLVEITQPAMNNYESGLRRPSLEVAIKIRVKTGVTLDWVYLGQREGLPARLLSLLPDLSPQRKAG
jgi:DNA-binding XRE family transcriptional regulator